MRTYLIIAIVSIFLVNTAQATTLRGHQQGDIMPDFTLSELGGNKQISFNATNGKPAALLFFSTRPAFRKKRSLALLAALDDLNHQLRGKANFLGLFCDQKGEKQVLNYKKMSAVSLPIVDDSSKEIYNKYGVFMMPLVVILDSSGKLQEVVPYTYNIREIVEANLRVVLGEWKSDKLKHILQPEKKEPKSEEDKEYIRRINYGKVMASRKMFGKAMREFSVAVKLKPEISEGYVELGFAQLALKKYQEAETTFRKALQKDSESDDGIAGLGLALYRKGDIDAAQTELENALISPKPRLEVIVALAELHENKGNVTRAMRLNKLAVSKLMTMYEHRWNTSSKSH